jgi:2-methylisocitrate lyase-like PEP mutase family enzyme
MTTTSSTQQERAEAFHRLHRGDRPLALVNAWDAVSARVSALAGAPALGTSSFAVALAHGYPDGETIPWEAMCATVAAITEAVDVPVTADVEAGYGEDAAAVTAAVAGVLDAGAVGINLEDSRPSVPGSLFDVDAQCERLAAARACADGRGIRLYLNARCDVYFGASVPADEQLSTALTRAQRYVEAGADGLFLPGLVDLETLTQVVAAVPVPLNVMMWPGLPPLDELARVGVRRVSQGAGAFLLAIGYLDRLTREYLDGSPDAGAGIVPAFHLVPELAYR